MLVRDGDVIRLPELSDFVERGLNDLLVQVPCAALLEDLRGLPLGLASVTAQDETKKLLLIELFIHLCCHEPGSARASLGPRLWKPGCITRASSRVGAQRWAVVARSG